MPSLVVRNLIANIPNVGIDTDFQRVNDDTHIAGVFN